MLGSRGLWDTAGADRSSPGLEEPPPPQGALSGMAAIARAQRAVAGGGQGPRDAPRRIITARPSVLPHSWSARPAVDRELEKVEEPPCPSRFLKVRQEKVGGRQWGEAAGSAVQAGNRQEPRNIPGRTSQARSSSALSKAAQLESKIMNRKKQMELQNLGQKPLDDESFLSDSSHEHSMRGKKYLKNNSTTRGNVHLSNACSKEEESTQSPKKNVRVKQQLGLDSDEEEMRELMESSLEIPNRNEAQKVVATDSKWGAKVNTDFTGFSHKEMSPTELPKASSFHNKDSEKNGFGRINSPTPSPAHRSLSGLHNMRYPSASSSLKDRTVKMTVPRKGYTKQSQMSLESDKSDVKSLDELFLEADDAEDSTSSSSNDFRLNILSLDDLAPDITSEAAELKQEGKDTEITQESNRNSEKDAFLVVKDPASLTISAGTGLKESSAEDVERTVTEAEISEHLSEFAAGFPGHKQDSLEHEEGSVNSEYSDDFERSLSTPDSKSVLKISEGHSGSCTYSGNHPPSASPVREQCDRAHRKTLKETAVQTVDLPFTSCWSQTNTAAAPDPPAGSSYVDPVPIASHIISMDTVEALTSYNPSVLVLNTMVKQHLMLIQQFVENIQHLHFSLVKSLEKENFHYHTLEETKEYIKNHKSPPLTMEQALEEIQKAQEEKLL
ncbi:uncharacterized protein C19orf44 homolog [Heliangelus exortis]|uniref:uncharacterized protein C19orf44 homolog n=1 Tax=Heliangelus exortis TaxID=472823 RepID=UPI003A92E9EF